jgi:hypothetical protein
MQLFCALITSLLFRDVINQQPVHMPLFDVAPDGLGNDCMSYLGLQVNDTVGSTAQSLSHSAVPVFGRSRVLL